jgi:hypothetical protein
MINCCYTALKAPKALKADRDDIGPSAMAKDLCNGAGPIVVNLFQMKSYHRILVADSFRSAR